MTDICLVEMISINAESDLEPNNETQNNIFSDFIDDYSTTDEEENDDYIINNVARSAHCWLQLTDSVNKWLTQTSFGVIMNNANKISS